MAEEAGDSDAVSTLTQQLSELEEKAEQLDKQRSRGLSAIRSLRVCIALFPGRFQEEKWPWNEAKSAYTHWLGTLHVQSLSVRFVSLTVI